MNREEVIKLAKNSGLFVELVLERDLDWLERFATLVASAEREACAKQLDALGCDHCATAIRARGQA
jgi:hypothetical protein